MLKKEKKKEKKKSRDRVEVLRYNFSPSDLAFNAKRLLTVLKSIWFRLRTKKLKHEHLSKFILDSSREKEKYLTPDISNQAKLFACQEPGRKSHQWRMSDRHRRRKVLYEVGQKYKSGPKNIFFVSHVKSYLHLPKRTNENLRFPLDLIFPLSGD